MFPAWLTLTHCLDKVNLSALQGLHGCSREQWSTGKRTSFINIDKKHLQMMWAILEKKSHLQQGPLILLRWPGIYFVSFCIEDWMYTGLLLNVVPLPSNCIPVLYISSVKTLMKHFKPKPFPWSCLWPSFPPLSAESPCQDEFRPNVCSSHQAFGYVTIS